MSLGNRRTYASRLLALCALMVVAMLAVAVPVASGSGSGAGPMSQGSAVGRLFSPGQKSLAVPPVFGPNVRANSDSTSNGQHEPGLAVSRTDPNVVVAASKDYRNGNVKQVWIYTSTDGGATWPVERQLQIPGIPADLPIQSDPVVMARDDGRIYVAALGTNEAQSRGGIFITWTDDNGATWRSPSVQVYYPENSLDDKEWFAIDNNPASPYYHRMYMMYAPSAAYVVEQHSTDGGVTWSSRQTIGSSNTEYTYPVVGSDGTVYNFMMLNWGPSRAGTVQMTKSTNGGATWTTPTTVATAQQPASPIRAGDQFRFFAILSAAVDPNNGSLYVAWTDNRNLSTNGTDVVYVKSTNGGATWSPITRLSHDPVGVVRDHITPMLVVDEDSRLHAFWLDRRLDPNNRLFDSWYSSSTDGGATWDPDTRVSTQSQDLNIGFPPGSGNAAGDYWGLDVSGDSVYVAWNDTREGNQDILVSRGIFQGGATPTASPTLTLPPTASATIPATATATATAPVNTPAPSFTPTMSATATATATGTTQPVQQCAPDWRRIPSDSPGTVRNLLESVDALAPDNIWAVGSYANEQDFYMGRRTLVQHWAGARWNVVPSPNMPGDYSALHAVDAKAANDIWAVGEYDSMPGQPTNPKTLAMHWDGTQWTIVPSPNAGTLQWGSLYDVTIVSTNDVWAVGMTFGDPANPFTIHWDGRAWTIVVAPPSNIEGCYLTGIDALATNDIWAVGYCSAPVGVSWEALTIHWDGTRWNHVPSPNPGQSGRSTILYAVEAIASNDVWAVGTYDEGTGSETLEAKSLVVHWDGSTWTHIPSPEVPSRADGLGGISAVSTNDIWAVGWAYENRTLGQPTAMHWNGSQWMLSDVLPPGTNYNALASVAALSSQDVWAVGFASAGEGLVGSKTLIEHYSLSQFSDVPPSDPFYAGVQCLACRGIVSGYADGTFRPNNPVTRGQLTKIVSNAMGLTSTHYYQSFHDVPPSHTFFQFVERLATRGFLTGYNCGGPGEPCISGKPYFRPFANSTRGQTAKIVSNAAGFNEPVTEQSFQDVPPSHTFYEFIQRLANRNVMSGYPCGGVGEPCVGGRPYFRPGNDVTRGQSAKIVANTFFPGCNAASEP